MEIVPAANEHIPQMVELWKDFIDYHTEFDPLFTRRAEGHLKFKEFVEELLEKDEALVLVALSDGKVAAQAIAMIAEYPPIYQIDKYGKLLYWMVKNEFRRQGIGERMLKRMKLWFKEKSIDRIELSVAARNEIGCSFWKKHGFREYVRVMCLGKLIENI